MTSPTERLSAALADRYLIERELGAGGMATVHLAHDLRHDRKVALKVLKPELAAVIGVERFLNEIKVTANLQHPHILPLYDSGSVDGALFYVMPYVEGETLGDRLRREKQLGVEESLRIAGEAAAALDYAHRHNVIHRDIKPANILLQDGGVLVADFGIALALRAAGGDRITETGLSLGTPHYMSPEQATGDRDVDLRTDIYALGAVLYEMLAGEPPHTGNTAQAIIARLLTEKPRPVASLRASVPDHVADAIDTALSKVPADRFATAADFARALRDPTVTRTRAAVATPVAEGRRALLWPAIAIGAVAFSVWTGMKPEARVSHLSWYEMAVPEHRASIINLATFTLTHDGQRFVFVGTGEGGAAQQLWVRDRDNLHATPIRGSEGAQTLTTSPDGKLLAYIATPARLRVIPIDGGEPVELVANVGAAYGLTWGDDGFIYVAYGTTVRRIAARGGSLVRIDSTWANGARANFRWIDMLPGSRRLLATPDSAGAQMVVTVDVATGARTDLAPGLYARYTPAGYIVVVSAQGGVTGAPFDAEAGIKGKLEPLFAGVNLRPAGFADLAVGGTRVLYRGGRAGGVPTDEAVWVGRDGGVTPIGRDWRFSSTGNSGWALSPDGAKLAIKLNSEKGGVIWIRDLRTQSMRRVTFDDGNHYRPRWSPDGQYVTYVGDSGGRSGLYRRRADGTGAAEKLLNLAESIGEGSITRDGKWIIGRTIGGTSGNSSVLPAMRDIWARRTSGDTTPFALLKGPAEERAFAVSPDGRWFAYMSDESGTNEVYVRPFPDVNSGKWQISMGSGSAPLWNPKGGELFYINGATEVVAVDLSRGPAEPGERTTLFSMAPFRQSTNYTWYDVDPTGQRFLMVRDIGATAGMVVIEDFPELLKRARK